MMILIIENLLTTKIKIDQITQKENNTHAHGVKVKMIDPKTGKVVKKFDCIADANKYVGVCKRNAYIFDICNGKQSSNFYRDYLWKTDE